ncbi:hypothetical protein DAPPUDRAFT_116182 [Daphnia pulex]|uniref:Yippee domain-containing protein n=1 Tax=Daphnia pulex TaxID=6669 RepID=E9HNU9_DAPPU|nr:hypothetical protein DAPPUDRAFT_116182 [Daphnia pulex]|eukprot:EFX66563.1 hypothetical protein DAPPUDRAFT_116182 [Daphnia pulex]
MVQRYRWSKAFIFNSGVLQWPTAKGAAAAISTQFSETLASLWPTRTAGMRWEYRIFGAHSDNIEAAGHPPQGDNNRQQNQQQLVNRRRRQRQAVVAAAGPVNRHNNNTVAHPRNNEQEPQAPERQQRNRRWMANGQHSTWFQGIHSMGHSLGSSSSDGPSSSSIKDPCRMVKTFQAYLPECCHRTYSCVHCRAHLANHDELISKSFQGSQGRAYLFNSVMNVGCGPAEERVLLTGLLISIARAAKPPSDGNM